MNKILLIKTGSTFPDLSLLHGDFEDWIISGTGADRGLFAILDVTFGDPLPFTGFSGVIITGSHSMVTDHPEWSERTAAWLKTIASTGIPILGICYGHQLLAHALGGKAGFNPSGLEFGTVDVALHLDAPGDPLFTGLPATIKAHVCHSQSALTLPPGATLLGSSILDPHQAFRIGSSVWGVQFHPEFDDAMTREYILRHYDQLLAEGKDPDDLLKTVCPTPHASSLLARFVEIVSRAW